ncbi:hypothetical protein RF11_00839 [Thelohanellus kitauei]|uniref:Uncharacterized protein n=1 Tax=Thelohanellus kitauei TaxID=669202 RepID=A0A0C2MUL8_THEKT|nr:hypothetical protein RF11_00839 [Thelohanellus kitauei]
MPNVVYTRKINISLLKDYFSEREGIHVCLLLITSFISVIVAAINIQRLVIYNIFALQVVLFNWMLVHLGRSLVSFSHQSIWPRNHTLINALIYSEYVVAAFAFGLWAIIYSYVYSRGRLCICSFHHLLPGNIHQRGIKIFSIRGNIEHFQNFQFESHIY